MERASSFDESDGLMDVEESSDSLEEQVIEGLQKQAHEQTDTDNLSDDLQEHVDDDNDDGSTCPICLDGWRNFGEHRLVSLRCGHLFGLSCIKQWFSQKQFNCPSCKNKAYQSHLRYIYARRLTAIDAGEYESVKRRLLETTKRASYLELEVTRKTCREQALLGEIDELKKQVGELTRTVRHECRPVKSATVRMYVDKSLTICQAGGCRVLDYSVSGDFVVASAKSSNALFPGYGVRKITISTCKPTGFIPLHSQSIRDVALHPTNDWLASVSLDKSVKVVDVASNASSGYASGEAALWACCWDATDPNRLHVGAQTGSVSSFDVRRMSTPVKRVETTGDLSPVVSLACLAGGDLLICKLNSLWHAAAACGDDSPPSPVSLDGPFISMKYDSATEHLLLSCRASAQQPHSRHLLCSLNRRRTDNDSPTLNCRIVNSFVGSPTQTYMSRSCFVPGGYVAAHRESSKRTILWSVKGLEVAGSVAATEPVLDLAGFEVGECAYVAALTESRLDFVKVV